MKYTFAAFITLLAACGVLASCAGSSRAMMSGGEVTGSRATSFNEPTPYGMVEVKRGFLKVGLEKNDSLWGTVTPTKEISVDGFWMDQSEVILSSSALCLYFDMLDVRLPDFVASSV